MKPLRLLSALLLAAGIFPVCLSGAAGAQVGIYGGLSGAAIHSGPTPTAWGALVGLYAQSGRNSIFGGDFRGSFVTRNGFHYNTGAIGPRVALKLRLLPLRPYVEGLAGIASYNSGAGTSSATHLSYHAVVGFDWTVAPRIDWRVLDYDFSGTSGSVRANIFSTGISIRVW